MLRVLQLSDIRAGPAQAVQCHRGGALVPGELTRRLSKVVQSLYKCQLISDRASADGECEQAVRDPGEVRGPGGDVLPGGQVQQGGRGRHQPHPPHHPQHGQGLVSDRE